MGCFCGWPRQTGFRRASATRQKDPGRGVPAFPTGRQKPHCPSARVHAQSVHARPCFVRRRQRHRSLPRRGGGQLRLVKYHHRHDYINFANIKTRLAPAGKPPLLPGSRGGLLVTGLQEGL